MTVYKLIQTDENCVAGRRERFNWEIPCIDATGARVAMGASDVVKFQLATTASGAALLNFTSSTSSANASSITIATRGSGSTVASGVVTLQAADTSTYGGTEKQYQIEIIHADDSNRISQPIRGKLVFLSSIT